MGFERYWIDKRFAGLNPLPAKAWLSSPTMHGEEQFYVDEAIHTNWVSTIGANIDAVEQAMAARIGRGYAVALGCGTAALHLATRMCGIRLYGQPRTGHGSLEGRKVITV